MKKVILIVVAVMLLGFVGKAQILENTQYRIKSVWSSKYLYIDDVNIPLKCSDIQPGWQSAVREFQNKNGNFWIKNNWNTKQCLYFENGIKCGEIQEGWQSAQWFFEKIEGTDYYRLKNIWNNTYLYIDGILLVYSNITIQK